MHDDDDDYYQLLKYLMDTWGISDVNLILERGIAAVRCGHE